MTLLRLLMLLYTCGLLSYGRGYGGSEECDSNKEVDVSHSALREVDKEVRREYEAIHKVHMHLDDDHDGNVDTQESAEFIEEELDEDNGSRHTTFHRQDRNDHITVKDVWGSWYKSEVYNWTVDEVVEWLSNVVHLPQYSGNFRKRELCGRDLPRIAINGDGIIQSELGITDSSHKKKLELRAMDAVLFGPPKVPYNWWKDAILAAVLLSCAVLVGVSWRERKHSHIKVDHLMALMKTAEDELARLQQKMDKEAELKTSDSVDEPVENPPPLKDTVNSQDDTMSLPDNLEDAYIKQLQSQISKLQAERATLLEQIYRQGEMSGDLQQLLVHTYLKEHTHWVSEKSSAEKQLATARKECEKIERRRGTLLGSIRMINSPVLHDADLKINRALVSLKKVMKNLDEYKRRWRAIENLTGVQVVSTSVHVKNEVVSMQCGGMTSLHSITEEVNYASGKSTEQEMSVDSIDSFDESDVETMSQYSVTSSTFRDVPQHGGSTHSMDHPYQHKKLQLQQQKLRNMKHSASEGKLPTSSSFKNKPSATHVGVYHRIEEEESEDVPTKPPSKGSPNIKRWLYKKSKGN